MFHLVRVPYVEMRESPSSQSKVVSGAIFAEEVDVEAVSGTWASIRTKDAYQGWVCRDHLMSRQEPYPKGNIVKISRGMAHLYHVKDTEYGPLLTLPYGVLLECLDMTDPRWVTVSLLDNTIAYVQRGDVCHDEVCTQEELVRFSKQFLGIPYTWGGRSSFGYDCSGFVQMLYGKLGYILPRDAKDQARDCRFEEVSLEYLAPGDLIFFGNGQREIKHVAFSCGKKEFIHTSSRENQPYLRVSQLGDFEWSGHSEAFYPYRIAKRLIQI